MNKLSGLSSPKQTAHIVCIMHGTHAWMLSLLQQSGTIQSKWHLAALNILYVFSAVKCNLWPASDAEMTLIYSWGGLLDNNMYLCDARVVSPLPSLAASKTCQICQGGSCTPRCKCRACRVIQGEIDTVSGQARRSIPFSLMWCGFQRSSCVLRGSGACHSAPCTTWLRHRPSLSLTQN